MFSSFLNAAEMFPDVGFISPTPPTAPPTNLNLSWSGRLGGGVRGEGGSVGGTLI